MFGLDRAPDGSRGVDTREGRWPARAVDDWDVRGGGSAAGPAACRSPRWWWRWSWWSGSCSPSVAGRHPSPEPRPRQTPCESRSGQYLRRRRQRPQHQGRLPRLQPLRAGVELRLRRRRRVQRADQGHQSLRQADQRRRRHQRPEDQPDHRQFRPHQRVGDAGAVQGLDRGRRARLRRARRGGHLDRATTSCASPRRATPRCSASGRRSPTGPRRARPTCGGPAPTMPPSCRPPSTGD